MKFAPAMANQAGRDDLKTTYHPPFSVYLSSFKRWAFYDVALPRHFYPFYWARLIESTMPFYNLYFTIFEMIGHFIQNIYIKYLVPKLTFQNRRKLENSKPFFIDNNMIPSSRPDRPCKLMVSLYLRRSEVCSMAFSPSPLRQRL